MRTIILTLAILLALTAVSLISTSNQQSSDTPTLVSVNRTLMDLIAPVGECAPAQANCNNVAQFCWDTSFFFASGCTINNQGGITEYDSCLCQGMRFYRNCVNHGGCPQKGFEMMQAAPGCFTQQ